MKNVRKDPIVAFAWEVWRRAIQEGDESTERKANDVMRIRMTDIIGRQFDGRHAALTRRLLRHYETNQIHITGDLGDRIISGKVG